MKSTIARSSEPRADYVSTAPVLIAPASINHRLLWFIDRGDPTSSALNLSITLRIPALLDQDRVTQAIRIVTMRHDSLRTTFSGRGGRLQQRISPLGGAIPEPVRIVLDSANDLADNLAATALTPFDIGDCCWRTAIHVVGGQVSYLSLTFHHLVVDYWSIGLVVNEIAELYSSTASQPDVGPAPSYVDFTRRQLDLVSGAGADRLARQWLRYLDGAQGLELVNAAPVSASDQSTERRVVLPANRIDLAKLAHGRELAVFLTAFSAAVEATTGQRSMTVSTLAANRVSRHDRTMVGYLSTLIPLRALFDPEMDFRSNVANNARSVIAALARQQLPLHMLPRVPGLELSVVSSVVFQVLTGPTITPSFDGVRTTRVAPQPNAAVRFPLEMTVAPTDDHLELVIRSSSRHVSSQAVSDLQTAFIDILTAALDKPEKS